MIAKTCLRELAFESTGMALDIQAYDAWCDQAAAAATDRRLVANLLEILEDIGEFEFLELLAGFEDQNTPQ